MWYLWCRGKPSHPRLPRQRDDTRHTLTLPASGFPNGIIKSSFSLQTGLTENVESNHLFFSLGLYDGFHLAGHDLCCLCSSKMLLLSLSFCFRLNSPAWPMCIHHIASKHTRLPSNSLTACPSFKALFKACLPNSTQSFPSPISKSHWLDAAESQYNSIQPAISLGEKCYSIVVDCLHRGYNVDFLHSVSMKCEGIVYINITYYTSLKKWN